MHPPLHPHEPWQMCSPWWHVPGQPSHQSLVGTAGAAAPVAGGVECDRGSSSTRTNSYRPFWNTVFSAAPARVFTAEIRVEFADEDTAFDDDICAPATIPFTTAAFSGATLTIGCAPSGTFNYRLTPAP
ncbi:MAG: hypothetical protein JWM10_1223 [Myxococcaceae bacterium]|nr:hypothetical protein [Myxococcaceae bacterium]